MTRNYKILYITSKSTMQGGGQRSLYLHMKHIDKSRYTPFVLVPSEGELSLELNRAGIETMILPFFRLKSLNPVHILITLAKLMRKISQNGIHLIHTDSPRETLYAGIAGKLLRIPVVVHLRVSERDLVDKVIYHLANRLIAVSRTVSERFYGIDTKGKIDIVYNGVKLDEYQIDSPVSQNSPLKVGYFGRIDKKKGIEVLIHAVNLVREHATLLIMGNGPNEYLEELKKISIGTKVIFREYKKDIRNEMTSVDIIVLPSFSEGLSRIIIESMALGKVVVASDLKENLEAMGEELMEFSFPVGDTIELAKILQRLANNKHILEEKKVLLRKHAELLFDIKKTTKQIEHIYEMLLS